jgi:hypothetical protein
MMQNDAAGNRSKGGARRLKRERLNFAVRRVRAPLAKSTNVTRCPNYPTDVGPRKRGTDPLTGLVSEVRAIISLVVLPGCSEAEGPVSWSFFGHNASALHLDSVRSAAVAAVGTHLGCELEARGHSGVTDAEAEVFDPEHRGDPVTTTYQGTAITPRSGQKSFATLCPALPAPDPSDRPTGNR